MSKKRFKKLLLSKGAKRDVADLITWFVGIHVGKLSYGEAWKVLNAYDDISNWINNVCIINGTLTVA